MKVVNKDKDFVISNKISIAESFFPRFLGLMFSKPRDLVLVSPREGVICSTIHMCFMRFPIDVLWLDSGMRVVDIKKKILPFNVFDRRSWRRYKPKNPAKYVIELGEGEIGDTEIGDEVIME